MGFEPTTLTLGRLCSANWATFALKLPTPFSSKIRHPRTLLYYILLYRLFVFPWYLLLRYRSNTLGNLNFRKEYLLVSHVRIIHITQVVPPYCHLVITTLAGILLSRCLLYWLTIIAVLIIINCDLGGTRTLDPSIKSAVLYLLSYEVISSKNYLFVLTSAKLRIIFVTAKCFTNFFSSFLSHKQ